jgi:hypothetical protein
MGTHAETTEDEGNAIMHPKGTMRNIEENCEK